VTVDPPGALERLVRRSGSRRAASAERCELCSEPLPAGHAHMLDRERDELLCACHACTLLFDRQGAGGARYRLLPDRCIPVDTDASPQGLGVPVGLAFFVRRRDGVVVAHYPSPAGATRWEVDPEAWRAAVERAPILERMEPDVEAFLVSTMRGASERWLVPIDDCYRLVALVRREWRGLSGGREVWNKIQEFFTELHRHRDGGPGDRVAGRDA
jgi:Family of unknown function (DUF5947)